MIWFCDSEQCRVSAPRNRKEDPVLRCRQVPAINHFDEVLRPRPQACPAAYVFAWDRLYRSSCWRSKPMRRYSRSPMRRRSFKCCHNRLDHSLRVASICCAIRSARGRRGTEASGLHRICEAHPLRYHRIAIQVPGSLVCVSGSGIFISSSSTDLLELGKVGCSWHCLVPRDWSALRSFTPPMATKRWSLSLCVCYTWQLHTKMRARASERVRRAARQACKVRLEETE